VEYLLALDQGLDPLAALVLLFHLQLEALIVLQFFLPCTHPPSFT
jgi:hypothetical protein